MSGYLVTAERRGRKVYWSRIVSKPSDPEVTAQVEWCWSDRSDAETFPVAAVAIGVANQLGGKAAGVEVENA